MKLFKRSKEEPTQEGIIVERRNQGSLGPSVMEDDTGFYLPGMEPNQIRARALMPYRSLSKEEQEEWIDPRILSMMVASEALMLRNGDVWEAFNSQIDLGMGPIIVSHEDRGIEKAYREMFERINIEYILEDAWITRREYGNAYTLVMGEGERFSVVNLNPKHVAVGRQLQVGQRPFAFFPNSRDPKALNSQFFHEKVIDTSIWNEWKDHGRGGVPLQPERVIHSHERKHHHMRYAYPPLMRAYESLTTRMVIGELIRGTAEGLKTQIRIWRLERPSKGEIGRLAANIRQVRSDRTYDLFWGGQLDFETVVPGTIDELLANETWMRLTNAVFRDLGMFLRLVSGEAPGDGTERGVQVEVQIALSRLKAEQRQSIQIARSIASLYSRYGSDRGLASVPLPTIRMAESVLSSSVLINEMYVPLMNYGIISIRTVLDNLGIDYETEISRIEAEADLRESVILPYTSFKQTAVDSAGNTKTVEHQQSQGRPKGRDLDPQHAKQNKDNRNQGS